MFCSFALVILVGVGLFSSVPFETDAFISSNMNPYLFSQNLNEMLVLVSFISCNTLIVSTALSLAS